MNKLRKCFGDIRRYKLYINIEFVLVNALIELEKINIPKIGFKQLVNYGLIVKYQYEKLNNKSINIGWDLSDVQRFVLNNNQLFKISEEEGEEYIYLNPGANMIELKEQFRWTLSYEMLKALNNINIEDILNI